MTKNNHGDDQKFNAGRKVNDESKDVLSVMICNSAVFESNILTNSR